MKIDLSKCKTPEDVKEAMKPMGAAINTVSSAWQKVFGEDEAEETTDETKTGDSHMA